MGNNWEDLLKAFVPLVFMAIWAITSLLNRDGKPRGSISTQARPNFPPANRPRPAEPTLRFGSVDRPPPASLPPRSPQRPAARSGQDEIVILSSTVNSPRPEPTRPAPGRPPARRPSKGRPSVPERRAEPAPARNTRLAGVTQNVNQQLANTSIEMAPLGGLSPIAASAPLGLGSAPSTVGTAATATASARGVARPAIALAIGDPNRLREVFVLNEILSPPVALRGRRPGPGPRG